MVAKSIQNPVVGGFPISVTGSWLKTAAVAGEEFVVTDPAQNADTLVAALRENPVGADVFTFAQRPPDVSPRYSFPMQWDNVALLPILGFAEWWEGRLNQDTRRCVRIAAKRGLVVRPVPFDDDLCKGICAIYNETPIRQGRKFWHYGKDIETVRRENSTFLDQSEFIGAYLGTELVGFIKMVYVGKAVGIMQILSQMKYYDYRPMNALMSKAVEICNEKKMTSLSYRKYVYYKGMPDSMTEFKRRNGFEQMNVPRYFVPLTIKGRLAIALGLQAGVGNLLPNRMVIAGRNLRSRYHALRGY